MKGHPAGSMRIGLNRTGRAAHPAAAAGRGRHCRAPVEQGPGRGDPSGDRPEGGRRGGLCYAAALVSQKILSISAM